MDSRGAESVPLEAHVEVLRGRCEAVCRLQGGYPSYGDELAVFESYVREYRYFLGSGDTEFLQDPPLGEGNEHQVWWEPARQNVVKATWPGFFGKLVLYASDESPNASPVGYLERWLLHCQLFGDSVEFLGVIDDDDGFRLVIRQCGVEGCPADEAQIREFFTTGGWAPFQIGDDLAFYDEANGVVISDTHPGNIVRMADGLFAPIDLRVQRLSSGQVDAVERLVGD